MDQVWIKEETLTAIGDSVRAKSGASGLLAPDAMLEALGNIKGSGKYLFSKKGATDELTTGSSGTKTMVTPNTSIPSVEIEYCGGRPSYNADTQTWDWPAGYQVYKETIVNTDTNKPSLGVPYYIRLTSAPNVWYVVSAFNVGTMNTSGTVTKSISYSSTLTAEVGSDILGYGVADDLAKYPDGGWSADGYYWECVGAPMIDFGINNVSYQAVDGMTWGAWVDSEYNTAGAVIMEGEVWVSGKLLRDGSAHVTTDDVIKGSGYGYATL